MTSWEGLSNEAFTERYASIFEHSPWVASRASRRRPFADLHAAFMSVVREANRDEQLTLIQAHPELAGRAAIDGTLTEASATEQASVGLDRMTATEYARFHALNAAYRTRFGFPFIICVRLTDKVGILSAMERRSKQDRDAEIATAIDEIGKIAALRLKDMA